MCLIVFAWRKHAEFPLVLAANRDEFHARPTDPMGWWADVPSLLAGRDRRAGGTWLGISRHGRLSTVTNYRENVSAVGELSRGEIVTGFAATREPPAAFLDGIDGDRYAGFSALACDAGELAYRSNRGDETRRLEPGIYGLGNASLDTPWPKVARSRRGLTALLSDSRVTADALFELMADRAPADDDEATAADLPFELGRELSAPFVVTPDYGTRCTTAVVCRADGHVEAAERRFDADGNATGESRFVFVADAWRLQPRP